MALPDLPEQRPEGNAAAATRQAAPRFDPMLVPRLRAAHAALGARFAELVGVIAREPSASTRAIEECARQFGAARQVEAIGLYPLLADAVAGDAEARGRLVELRLVALMLTRRVLRYFDELLQAARVEVMVADPAARVAAALASYARHSDEAVYPLYEMIGPQRQDAVHAR